MLVAALVTLLLISLKGGEATPLSNAFAYVTLIELTLSLVTVASFGRVSFTAIAIWWLVASVSICAQLFAFGHLLFLSAHPGATSVPLALLWGNGIFLVGLIGVLFSPTVAKMTSIRLIAAASAIAGPVLVWMVPSALNSTSYNAVRQNMLFITADAF